MSDGTSWKVQSTDPGTSGYRIRLAFQRGDVRWTSERAEWLSRHFDRTLYSQRVVNALIRDHINADGPITGQINERGKEFPYFFSVNIPLAGELRYIKFCLCCDEDENPEVIIVSAHPPY